MPNPLFLKVMGVDLNEYNTYSPNKKDRFQKAAQRRLAEVHGSDIEAYSKLTAAAEQTAIDDAEKAAWEIAEDERNS